MTPRRNQVPARPIHRAAELALARAELVVAGLTVLRAYISAGRPCPLDKIGSFEDWNLVRECMVWLDRADPADTRQYVLGSDPRKTDLVEVLTPSRNSG